MYDQTGVDIDFRSPYHEVDPWREVARQFDIVLERANPRPGEWVLDLGAGRGWAAKHLALRGCQVVAVEIVDDDQVGLGRSRALMQEAGVVYDTMIADSENLPFADASFDMVFGAAVLHHTTDLDLLLRNIGRILRPGGRLVAINEPCIHDASDDAELQRTVLAEELAYGINETRPRLDDYRRALHQAGMQEQDMFAFHAYGLPLESLAAWSRELGILPPAAVIQPEDIALYTQSAAGQPWQAPRIWMDYLLRQCGGTLILIATRTGA
jgi:SAM-dependent methyltransferase